MAKRTIPKGDTFEPLKFSVKDQRGLVDLTAALGPIVGFFQGRDARGDVVGTITGTIMPIAPPEDGLDEDGRPIQLNAQYDFEPGDTDRVLDYQGQIRVEWTATPGEARETFPSGTGGQARFFEFAVVENLDPGP